MSLAPDPDKLKPAAGKRLPARRTPVLTRATFVRLIPFHLLLAALFGAGTAVLLGLLGSIQLAGRWQYVMVFPIGALYVNGVVLPVSIPGRHWSFGFLCSMMLILICMAGGIISTWLHLPHSTVGTVFLSAVNTATFLAVVTGASIGLFYGLLVGERTALTLGAVLGAMGGYILGLLSALLISHEEATRNQFIYNSWFDYAWQGAAGLLGLHLFGAVGALMGAAKTE